MEHLAAAFFALLVGVIATAAGVGGGSFLVPYMIMVDRLPPLIAVGTSLAIIFPASLAASLQYWRRGLLDNKLAAAAAPPALVGAVLGARATPWLGGERISLMFGLVVAMLGLWVARPGGSGSSAGAGAGGFSGPRPVVERSYPASAGGGAGGKRLISLSFVAATAFAAAFLGAILGIGGGFLLTPVLVALFGVPARFSVAVSMLVIAVVSLAGGIAHRCLGHLSPVHAWWMGAGLLAGSLLGPMAAHRLRERTLRRLIAGVLSIVGVMMIVRAAARM